MLYFIFQNLLSVTCLITGAPWSGVCHVFTPRAVAVAWLLSTSASVYQGKTNDPLSQSLQHILSLPNSPALSLSFSVFATHKHTSHAFLWLQSNVDTVNNWHWHSKVNLAPPHSHFSPYPGDTATWLVCLSALTATPTACLAAFPPAAVTMVTCSHFGITLVCVICMGFFFFSV